MLGVSESEITDTSDRGRAKWTADDIPDQTGRTVLVTGANSGLGLRTSEALAAKGAAVLMACRNQQKAADALEAVKGVATGPAPEVIALDLADLSSIQRAAEEVDAKVERVDILINNAGVMALPKTKTADGFEMQLGTNHLGHFALTGRLMSALARAEAPRVVTVSSNGHRMGRMKWDNLMWESGVYSKWLAYGRSKLANLLFAFELDRRARVAESPLVSVAAHPGYAATNLSSQGPQMSGRKAFLKVVNVFEGALAQSDAQGALPQLFAATEPGVTGGSFYGPDGFMGQRGYPERQDSSSRSKDEADATRLWEWSEQQTGVTYPF
jgi:NAD(P)-dependent dehydrogenase (short-subunit alcohol dehydrogenase family)